MSTDTAPAPTPIPEKRGPGRPRKHVEVEGPAMTEEVPYSGLASADVTAEMAPPPLAVLGHLRETGTPLKPLRLLEAWLDQHATATSAELYLHMVDLEKSGDINVGTLRKAGKLVHGKQFEPECLVKQAPADELVRLREENDRLQQNIRNLEARCLGLTNQNTHLQERLIECNRTISFLKIGRSNEDLAAAGLNTPAVAY